MDLSIILSDALKAIETQTKHKHYQHTVDIAKDYKALITGDKEVLGEYLRTLKKREPEEDKKERIELTEFINKSVGEHLVKNIRKLMRLGNVHVKLQYERAEGKVEGTEIVDFTQKFKKFSQDGDVNGYIEDDLLMQSIIDPNTFVIIDKFLENGVEMPYAKDISSKYIFDFKYEFGTLKLLIVETEFEMMVKEELKSFRKYHVYTPETIIVLTELEKNKGVVEFDYLSIEQDQTIRLKEDCYNVEIYPTELGVIPAFRLGFKPDLRTNRETKESFIEPAVPYLKKLVASVSEFDLANLKHAFPRLFGYEQKCPGDIRSNKICDNGKIKSDNSTCDICNGKGILVPRSSLDSITLPLPKDPNDLHDLSKLSHTESTNIELLNYMKEMIADYVQEAENSIYGVVTLKKSEVVKTATEKLIEQESISDSLEPFAKSISKWWISLHFISAKLLKQSKDLIIEHRYPRNLRIQSVSEMIEEIKILKDSGADSIFLEAIQDEIAEKRFIDKPTLLEKYKVYREHKPLNGDNEQSAQFKITSGLVSQRDAILWANFIDIMESIDFEQKENGKIFIDIPKSERVKLIESKLDEYMSRIAIVPELTFEEEIEE